MFLSKYFKKMLLVLPFLATFVIFMFVFTERYNERLEAYYESKDEALLFQLESTLMHYGDFSDYFYQKVIDDEHTLELISNANDADEAERDLIREELYNYYIEDYLLMQNYEFRQFHFHLADLTSFLRMHRPEKYGDSLVDVRYSVEYVNEFNEPISGFEEGRIFNGYRFVYPLEYEGEHIGSVEVSVSMSSVLKTLTEMFPNRDYCMIIDKTLVDSKVFDSELDNYEVSYVSDAFYFDKESQSCVEVRNITDSNNFQYIFANANIDDEDLLDYSNKLYNSEYDGVDYEIFMVPIVNVEGSYVGYFVSASEGFEQNTLWTQHVINIVALTIITVGLYVIIYLINDRKKSAREISLLDSLTNLYNRRFFNEKIEREISRSKRTGIPFSLLMFDIDHFKVVNDNYGHEKGDQVLVALAQRVSKAIRKEDTFVRYGGEEFVVILTNTEKSIGEKKAEQIRALISDRKVADLPITVSIGVTDFNNESTPEGIVSEADKAMYEAKNDGRNKVKVYDSKVTNS